MIKRTFDLALSALVLIVALPFILVISLWIKLSSQGPVIYGGVRIGRNGKHFKIYKFRTMVPGADQIGGSFTHDSDKRVTRAGAFLRATKLDELPQFINVIRGDMSVVGPRPQVGWVVDLYSEADRRLLAVRPGITDYSSLVFIRLYDLLKYSADQRQDYLEKVGPVKVAMGLDYVDNNSVYQDIKVVAATALAICRVDPAWCIPPKFLPVAREIRQMSYGPPRADFGRSGVIND